MIDIECGKLCCIVNWFILLIDIDIDEGMDVMVEWGWLRSFDKEVVLDCVMEVFWCFGYEGVLMMDLMIVMGIVLLSLYVVFGSKEVLFW